tara:strand:+ start:79 stop:438 length:360 start_codon:yes stop_codon:yes gene_type:complete
MSLNHAFPISAKAVQRLANVGDVRKVMDDAIRDYAEFELSELVAYVLVTLHGTFATETNTARVTNAVKIDAASASPATFGFDADALEFDGNHIIKGVTPQLVAAMCRAIRPQCCKKVCL